MSNILNYRYEIFPTAPQRVQLNRILREARLQWNRAVTSLRKLKAALRSGQVEYVIHTCLLDEKNNSQAQRKKAILRFQDSNPKFSSLDFDSAAKLYSIKNLVGNVMYVDERHLDTGVLAGELMDKYNTELDAWKKARADGGKGKLPQRPVYWQLINAIKDCAGVAAKTYMDKSFSSSPGMSLASLRSFISGYATSKRWNQAVKPKKGQRAYGATGQPRYKKRGEGFAYQEKGAATALVQRKKKGHGHLILVRALPKGMWLVPMAYHRPVPDGAKIKQLTINAKGGRFFAVLSAEVPDSAWRIAPMEAGWHAGIDPGAMTALTVALKNEKSGELAHLAIHYEFLEKSLEKLEKMQQSLARKSGPRRKRTLEEVNAALEKYLQKSSVNKLSGPEREKARKKRKEDLERRMVRNEHGASKRWKRWAMRVSALQMKIANRRSDVLHKISKALAEGCDMIGIGHWEPEREVSYRKRLKAAKKKVRIGVQGAAEELQAIENEKSKQGPKGSKKKRRGGRDRSIATLRRLVEEKAVRSSVPALTDVNEAYSTVTCCVCRDQTGPRGDLSVREWTCTNCKTVHHRDLNSGFNILRKTETEIAAAQAAALETGPTAARTIVQGATERPGGQAPRATGHSGRGGSFFYGQTNGTLPNLWDKDVPKALKSLIQMGIARSLTLHGEDKTDSSGPS